MSQSPDHSIYSLYCGEDAGDVHSWDSDDIITDPLTAAGFEADDDSFINRLLDSELHHMPESDYLRRLRDRSIDVTARQDAINWMLKVHAFYHFRPVTAFLSINYFDRFLSVHPLPENGWPLQLLSVACMSLAAKIEEKSVPLLLDLQMFKPKFVFEPKTVQRMELLVMANLKWRMHSVTPFDFIHHFITKLRVCVSLSDVISRASDLILSSCRVIDFLGYRPSTRAAAAVLSVAGGSINFPSGDDRETRDFYERLDKEMVRSCHRLMEEHMTDTCPPCRLKYRRTETAPPSPVGVLDAATCGSCDTQKSDNPDITEAEPPNKRRKLAVPDV